MTNVVQIQRKEISFGAQPFLFLVCLTELGLRSEFPVGPTTSVPLWNAARKLGDFPSCNSEAFCRRHLEHAISKGVCCTTKCKCERQEVGHREGGTGSRIKGSEEPWSGTCSAAAVPHGVGHWRPSAGTQWPEETACPGSTQVEYEYTCTLTNPEW